MDRKLFEVIKKHAAKLLPSISLDRIQVEVVKTIKYKPNCFVMFLNTNRAVHGVTPRINSQTERLSINIIAEVTDRKYKMFSIKKI